MAGDWLKIRLTIGTDPKVFAISKACGVGIYETIGRLVRFWAWVTHNTNDGLLSRVTSQMVSEILEIPLTFFEAIETVGWLETTDKGLVIPKFDRWFGRAAEIREQAKLRQAEWRSRRMEKRNANVTQPVTHVSQDMSQKNNVSISSHLISSPDGGEEGDARGGGGGAESATANCEAHYLLTDDQRAAVNLMRRYGLGERKAIDAAKSLNHSAETVGTFVSEIPKRGSMWFKTYVQVYRWAREVPEEVAPPDPKKPIPPPPSRKALLIDQVRSRCSKGTLLWRGQEVSTAGLPGPGNGFVALGDLTEFALEHILKEAKEAKEAPVMSRKEFLEKSNGVEVKHNRIAHVGPDRGREVEPR